MTSRSAVARWFLSLLTLVAVVAGCDDDVTGPGDVRPTLEELWPVDEESTWMYHWAGSFRAVEAPTLYDSPGEVPPVPGFDAAHGLLTGAAAPDPAADQFYELALEGPDTTAAGVAGRRLRASAFLSTGGPAGMDLDGARVLLEHLARHRPDLRERIPTSANGSLRMGVGEGPLFLRGGILESTVEHVALYGDLDEQPGWLFLVDDLSVGSEFTLQIAPAISDDIYLHGQVRRQVEVEISGRALRGCVEVLYVLDLGVSTLAVDGGEGHYRSFDVGAVVYAPSLGPVSSDELIGLTSAEDEPRVRNRLELRPDALIVPPHPTPPPDLDNIWPNQDGDRWTYRSDAVIGIGEPATLYATPEEVPPLPDLDEMLAWLDAPLELSDPSEIDAYMRLEFAGMVTIESGAVAQNLTESFWYPSAVDRTFPGRDSWQFVAQILRHRPELSGRVASVWPERAPGILIGNPRQLPEGTVAPRRVEYPDALPFILFGYAWEKTSEHIGTYGDLDQLLAWKFLESDLRPGHQFRHQLVPALTDDIWLHGRVIGNPDVSIGGRTYRDCVEVAYVIEYGITRADGLAEERYYRTLHAGTISYAPGVGPVACRERVDFGWRPITQDLSRWTVADRKVTLVEVRVEP